MKNEQNQSDLEYKILRNLENNPKVTQREVATELNLSLGKTNYLIRSLIDMGYVKLNNFRKHDNKIGYLYLLTPKGIKNKSKLAKNFLERKSEEYARLKEEIEQLKEEI